MKKYLFGIFAVAFALAIASFTTSERSLTTKIYKFNSTNLTDASDPLSWQDVSEIGAPQCEEGSALPCRVIFETTSYANITAFINGRSYTDVFNDPLVVKKAEE
jgi:hypothetical protein